MINLFFFLGGIPLRILFLKLGSQFFWLISALMIGILWSLSGDPEQLIVLGSLTVLIGLYSEVEKRLGFNRFISALLAVLVSGGISLSFYFQSGQGIYGPESDKIKAEIGKQIEPMIQSGQKPEELVNQLFMLMPGLYINSLLIVLVLSLIFERVWLRSKSQSYRNRKESLLHFKLPEHLVWFSCFFALGAFTDWLDPYPNVHGFFMNAAIILVGCYFFQGLAVAVHFVKSLKMGSLFQTLILIVLLGQIYFLSFIGFVDLWIDFRKKRIKKRT